MSNIIHNTQPRETSVLVRITWISVRIRPDHWSDFRELWSQLVRDRSL